MEAEASPFETSEMLAEFMGSTPLLSESWRFCRLAYDRVVHYGKNFVVDQIGDVGYVAFSQTVVGFNPYESNLVEIHNGLFPSLRGEKEDEEPPMVHAGFQKLFLSICNTPDFQNQMMAIMEKSKSIIVTGHSIGGTTASLAALWLLSHSQSLSPPRSILCITFGSPLLGNQSLSKTILRERWGSNFCHLVSKHDIVPRLLFAPLPPIIPQLNCLLKHWLLLMTSPQSGYLATQLSEEDKSKLHHYVLVHMVAAQDELTRRSPYKPFGSYMFCSKEGTICVENVSSVIQILHLMFTDSSANSSIDDHIRYEELVMRVSLQFLRRRSFTPKGLPVPESSYEVGISMALEASGMECQDLVARQARECLMKARQMGRTPNLNSANLAVRLSKITPYRAQIEWYKTCCEDSDDQMGYYDSFKLRGDKRDFRINMNRVKLANFWDDLLSMLETNQLPHDFHKRDKFVNASQFYKLLVEPLDIAEYYRSGIHRTKGHYLTHGRERRYEVFDRWWHNRKVTNEDNNKRSKFAGLTQDSCFWARVEEAREWVNNARNENDPRKLTQLWENINKFELYARRLVENKEVSRDVVAKKSSYKLWEEEWMELKSQLMQIPRTFPG